MTSQNIIYKIRKRKQKEKRKKHASKNWYYLENLMPRGRKFFMYVFNKIIVNPQLPKRINRLGDIANNLWWSWNTNFLRLFKEIDIDLWEKVEKNPVKFLKLVSQEKLEQACNNQDLLKKYDKYVDDLITT